MRLLGLPGEVITSGSTVILALESRRPPSMPDEFPPLPDRTVRYVVYLAAKQWQRLEQELSAPQRLLAVEGPCFYDSETQSLAVLARKAETKAERDRRPGRNA